MALLNDYSHCDATKVIDGTDGCVVQTTDFPVGKGKDLSSDQLKQATSTANNITMKEFIERVYAARRLYVKAFNVPSYVNIINIRYKNEPERLIEKTQLK
jgi:hypothetical protein